MAVAVSSPTFGNAHQQPAGRRLTRQLRELTLQLRDTDLEHADLLEQLLHDRTQQCADGRLIVGHSACHGVQTSARPYGHMQAQLAAETA